MIKLTQSCYASREANSQHKYVKSIKCSSRAVWPTTPLSHVVWDTHNLKATLRNNGQNLKALDGHAAHKS